MKGRNTYLIAGASSGIGFEIATQLLEAGNEVIAMSRTRGQLPQHTALTFFPYDFMGDAPMPEILRPLDGMVYCPGSITLKPLRTIRETDLIQDFRINVVGAFRFVNAYSALMKDRPSASIVLFSSVAAHTGMPFHASVSASKAAVEGLTKALAAEFAPSIRVNCIAPSLTDTPLAATLLNSEVKRQSNAMRHPMKSLGNPGEIASAAIFLLTEARWATAQVFKISGGLGDIMK